MPEDSNNAPPSRPASIRTVFFTAQLEAVMRESRWCVFVFLGAAAVSAYSLLNHVELRILGGWMAAMAVFSIIGYLALGRMLRVAEKEQKAVRWARQLDLGAFCLGSGWGAFTAYTFPGGADTVSLLLLVTAGLLALAVIALSPVLSIFWSFALPVALPLAARSFYPRDGAASSTGIILLGYLALMGFAAWQHSKRTRSNIREKVITHKEVEVRRLLEKELIQQREVARVAVAERRLFMTNVGLELRTHLNTIIGFARILQRNADDNLSERDVSRSERIYRNGRQLLLVINNVLDLSRIESNQLELDCRLVNPRDLVDESVELLRDAAAEKGLRLSSKIADNIPEAVETDPTRIWQILSNLIGNAIKFTKHGQVDVSLDRIRDSEGVEFLKFSVRDTGPGIDEKTRAGLFLPFAHSVDDAQGDSRPGMGIGLIISKTLVELLGGKVDMWTKPGEGSNFNFTIPCDQPSGADE